MAWNFDDSVKASKSYIEFVISKVFGDENAKRFRDFVTDKQDQARQIQNEKKFEKANIDHLELEEKPFEKDQKNRSRVERVDRSSRDNRQDALVESESEKRRIAAEKRHAELVQQRERQQEEP